MARLVVVDATEWILSMLVDALREAGHEVRACLSAGAGLAAVRAARPDCLICDVELPDHDGAWLVQRVRAEALPVGATPVLLVAASSAVSARVDALRAGADACVSKPYRTTDVLRQVEALVRMSARLGGARELASTRPPEAGPEAAIVGSIASVSVSTLLSIFEVERRSGLFDVESADVRARLHLARGLVTEARLSSVEAAPIEAVRAMLALTEGRFTFTPERQTAAQGTRGVAIGVLLATAEQRPSDVGEPAVIDEDAIEIEADLSSYRPPASDE
jgi:CheY-like chemotaxis protein